MTAVAPEWLMLREPADAAARSGELAAIVARRVRPAVVHDLGGGTGAMGRWLAPRLPGRQHWVVHDRDAALLERALADPPGNATVEVRQADLARLTPTDLAGADLVVASALLDMLTAGELTALLASAAGRPMLVALTVVGRVALVPQEPLDARVGTAFNAHQRRRLGPDAVPVALRTLANTGAEVLVRPSPWCLGAAQAGLSAEWFDGWVAAAVEQAPELARPADAYRERRLAQAAAGTLEVSVGHVDILVL
ncbi:MAG: hypothetical protein QOF76_666, partial [Solirubrobacteraceae bacterium]|nr:hypothetical protein [Solirubrobacteraceae bacterium]